MATSPKHVDDDSRREREEVEHQARAGFTGVQVARGNLSATPFPEVLAQLYRWRSTGALLLRRDKVKKIVFLKDGYPLLVKSNLLSECLGKVMLRERMISAVDCERSIAMMKETGRQQGAILVEMGCISPHNLGYALQLQMETKLYDVFAWMSGEYQFNPRGEIPAVTRHLDLSPANLILEGLRRTWSVERLRNALNKHLDSYVAVHPDPLQRMQDVELTPAEAGVVSLLDGKTRLKDVLQRSPLKEAASLSLAYGLVAAQVVQLRSTPALRATPALPPPVPVPPPLPAPAITPASGQPPPIRKAPPTPSSDTLPAARAPAAPALSSEERTRVEQLTAKVKELRGLNFFELLGISRKASADEVKKAYFSQAKDYHPDRHFGSSSREAKALADQIYSLLSQAYEVLSDPREREEYARGLRGSPKSAVSDEVSRILAAEARFQKGESFMRRKDWTRAVACFKEAVQLYPDEGEFECHLGWALYQGAPQEPSSVREAEDHLLAGLRRSPRVDRGHLFLGWLYKLTGRKELALKEFAAAMECNPDNLEAVQEIKRMSQAGTVSGPRRRLGE